MHVYRFMCAILLNIIGVASLHSVVVDYDSVPVIISAQVITYKYRYLR